MTNSGECTETYGTVTEVLPEEKQFAQGFECKLKELEEDVFKTFEEMLQICQPHEVMLAFNGGKDCTVILYLLEKFYRQLPLCQKPIVALYIKCPNSFPEVDRFVEYCQSHFQLTFIKAEGETIKIALEHVCRSMPHIKCVVIGSRRTDPFCSQATKFQATDPGWPPLIRVNAILDWSYSDVWKYLFSKNIPYCSLYRQGYTSLGSTNNTVQNPLLKAVDVFGKGSYMPAYLLGECGNERAGRL